MSNLTNLLAYHGAGISFTKFTLLMALPWLSAVAAVYVVFRWFSPGIYAWCRTGSNSSRRRACQCSCWWWWR